jgi:hypothetical protein
MPTLFLLLPEGIVLFAEGLPSEKSSVGFGNEGKDPKVLAFVRQNGRLDSFEAIRS